MVEQSQYVDYEQGCKRCGKCCSPAFMYQGNIVRIKSLCCIYLDGNNNCTIYHSRKRIMGCLSPGEMPGDWFPCTCSFGGKAIELEGEEEMKFMLNPPFEFLVALAMKLFKWRR